MYIDEHIVLLIYNIWIIWASHSPTLSHKWRSCHWEITSQNVRYFNDKWCVYTVYKMMWLLQRFVAICC